MSSKFEIDDAAMAELQKDALAWVGKNIAEPMLTKIRSTCPVDTGALRASLDMEAVPDEKMYKVGSRDSDYIDAVEFGTSKMPAQPFMRPAAYGGP